MHYRSGGRRVEIERAYGYVFVRFPWLGEVLWDQDGVKRWSWSGLRDRLRHENATQQAAHEALSQ